MSAVITGIEPKSLADKKRIKSGDTLLRINGHEIEDVLDYSFYMAERRVDVEIERDGKVRKIHIKKEEYADLGLTFGTYLMDSKRSCRNHCIFCFIDQLPAGLRDTLYFKDDDARLSFLMGNYITLTNLSQRDVERIIEMKISPVNISVHTTNPELRGAMMRNRDAGDVLSVIPRFSQAGIKMNCQLVLCPGINDGAELERSLRDLSAYYPSIENIAAVPVGITRYREGLYPLKPYDREGALAVVHTIEAFGADFFARHGTRLAFAADEFYLKAGLAIPDAEFYEEMNQLENGVGLIAQLGGEFASALGARGTQALDKPRTVSIATGTAAGAFINKLADSAQNSIAGLQVMVYPIVNDFFGERITVAGLLTGRDLIAGLAGRELGDVLLIPASTLKSDSDLFLDDVTLSELKEKLGVPVLAVPNDGYALLDAMVGAD